MHRIGIPTLAAGLCLSATFAPASASTYTVQYSFQGNDNGSGFTDGANPRAGLIAVGGTLDGTTEHGGGVVPDCPDGCGTVFSVTPGGGITQPASEIVLYGFAGHIYKDGAFSEAGLSHVGGALYGTTFAGGHSKYGTVFTISLRNLREREVYSFNSGSKPGAFPAAGLLDVGGTLYGTTSEAGGGEDGEVFAITKRTETVVYPFQGQMVGDGAVPMAGLIDVDGTLYGTTSEGGNYVCPSGCGTVFSLNPATGAETVLHVFGDGSDGATPEAGLIDVGGVLYGTTFNGGNGRCIDGCGTVFSLSLATGAETVLYTFQGGTDGGNPEAGVIDVRGVLYGTTSVGGGSEHCSYGCGTVFSLDLATGTETVLHAFGSGKDGRSPRAGLLNVGGTFYGTTYTGGDAGQGTVFSYTP